jgi:hypothetical protein
MCDKFMDKIIVEVIKAYIIGHITRSTTKSIARRQRRLRRVVCSTSHLQESGTSGKWHNQDWGNWRVSERDFAISGSSLGNYLQPIKDSRIPDVVCVAKDVVAAEVKQAAWK